MILGIMSMINKSQVDDRFRYRSWLLKDKTILSCILFRNLKNPMDCYVQWEITNAFKNRRRYGTYVVSGGFADDRDSCEFIEFIAIRNFLKKLFKEEVIGRYEREI